MSVSFVRGVHLATSRRRGAAYVEALLVIGFCSVVWAAIVGTGRLQLARQQARAQARSCAWAMAISGCREVPAQCAGPDVTRRAPNPRLQEGASLGAIGVVGEGSDDDAGVVAGSREAVEAEIEGLVFERIAAKGVRRVRHPLREGGETVEIEARYSLPCNSRPSSVSGHARDAFAKILAKGQR